MNNLIARLKELIREELNIEKDELAIINKELIDGDHYEGYIKKIDINKLACKIASKLNTET